jgi:hypothetical protein
LPASSRAVRLCHAGLVIAGCAPLRRHGPGALVGEVMARSGKAPAWPTPNGRYGRHPGPPRPSRPPRTERAPRPGRAVVRHHPGCARVRRRLRTRSRCNRR